MGNSVLYENGVWPFDQKQSKENFSSSFNKKKIKHSSAQAKLKHRAKVKKRYCSYEFAVRIAYFRIEFKWSGFIGLHGSEGEMEDSN